MSEKSTAALSSQGGAREPGSAEQRDPQDPANSSGSTAAFRLQQRRSSGKQEGDERGLREAPQEENQEGQAYVQPAPLPRSEPPLLTLALMVPLSLRHPEEFCSCWKTNKPNPHEGTKAAGLPWGLAQSIPHASLSESEGLSCQDWGRGPRSLSN